MSAICRFCAREFTNAQAVRAHLKGCEAYQNRPPKAAVSKDESLRDVSLGKMNALGSLPPEGSSSTVTEFDPVRQMEQRIATEQLRLKLRELDETHCELDRREQERRRAAEKQAEALLTVEEERKTARLRDKQTQKEAKHKETVECQYRNRRRELIQEVKRDVVDHWGLAFIVGSDVKSQILQEIERTLSALPVDELPREELIEIAKGVRDGLHGQEVQAQQRAQQQVQQHAAHQQRIVQHGMDYAARELRGVDGLNASTRRRIERLVRNELEEVHDHETQADVEDRVDVILESEGIEYDDEG